jgi:hypothetical protein
LVVGLVAAMIVWCYGWTVNPEWNRAAVELMGDGFELTWPPFGGVRRQRLVFSGEIGKGDQLYVKYPGERGVAFGYGHWGVGGFETEPIAVEPGTEMVLDVDCGALHPALVNSTPAGRNRWRRA